jgi:hypothetical protein
VTLHAGIVPGLLDDVQHPLGKSDVQRFVWNFLGNATAAGNSTRTPCSGFDVGDCDGGEVCVGATGVGVDSSNAGAAAAEGENTSKGEGEGDDEGDAGQHTRRSRRALLGSAGGGGGGGTGGGGNKAGACVRASPRFVPALSSRLAFDRKTAAWVVSDPSPVGTVPVAFSCPMA